MPKRRLLIQNACYHIYARGNNKQVLFKDNEDFHTYIRKLKFYKKKFQFLIYAYCLMPNHLHIIGEPTNPNLLSRMMQCLHRSYSQHFKQKYNYVGQIWQGRFKSKIILKDQYLAQSISYVEFNPVRSKLTKKLENYLFCSYQERISPKPKIIDHMAWT